MPEQLEEQTETSVLANLPLPQIYFDAGKQCFWAEDGKGGWMQINEKVALMRLHFLGISNKKGKELYSLAERVLDMIRNEHRLAYAGRVAGQKVGIYGIGANRYLVTSNPELVKVEKGDWSEINTLAIRLVGKDQIDYLYGWQRQACLGLYRQDNNFAPVLFLAGPAGCGKSFWQHNVITPILGGSCARPIQYMTGKTTFNADLIGSEHWAIEDDHASVHPASRRELGTSFKNVVANKQQRLHPKGRDAIAVQSRHWISGSINDEPENMSTLPELDESLQDKLLLLHCNAAINSEWPGDHSDIVALEGRVKEQLGAFVWWLLNEYQVPGAIIDQRFGVKGYQNPELVSRIENGKPLNTVEELIEAAYNAHVDPGYVVADHMQITERLMEDSRTKSLARSLFNGFRTVATCLKSLQKQQPEKYWHHVNDSRRPRRWVIRYDTTLTVEEIIVRDNGKK